MRCRYCNSKNTVSRGKLDTGRARYRCKDCGKWGSEGQTYQRFRSAKILLLDIETLPGEYYAFAPAVEYLAPVMQIKDWSIACYAAKWLFDDKVMGQSVTAQQAFDREDHSILESVSVSYTHLRAHET